LIAAERYHLLGIAGDVALGWWLVSLYRSYGMTMLVAFRTVTLGILLIGFLWYASMYAIQPETSNLPSLALVFRRALGGFLLESTLIFAGGYLATRRPELTWR
jgi:hypothetical protein